MLFEPVVVDREQKIGQQGDLVRCLPVCSLGVLYLACRKGSIFVDALKSCCVQSVAQRLLTVS